MRRGLWPVAFVLVLALCGLASAAGQRPGLRSAEPPPLTTAYVAQLRTVAAQVQASRVEVSRLPALTSANKATLTTAGGRLATAAAAVRDVLRTYRDARTRYGTAEEWRLAQQLLVDLQAARTTYGQHGGVTLPAPSPQQRSQAVGLFEEALATVANEQIVRWTGDQGLADALTSGGIATVKVQLRQELVKRLRTQAETAITNATGFAVVLNVPLKQQVVFQVQRLASTWLARAVLHVSPQGLVIQLAGAPIVRWISAQLQAALRNSGNAAGRAESTMAQFAKWRNELLLLSPTSSLADARALSAKIDRELNRTGFLKLDLRRAGKSAMLGRLEQSESVTRTAVGVFRLRFLLDSPMARADLNAMVDQAKRLLREIEEITKKLGAAPAGSGAGILGDWESYGQPAYAGVFQIRIVSAGAKTFSGRLIARWAFGRNCVAPSGQEMWKMEFDPVLSSADHPLYKGTARAYDWNTCAATIADVRWVYHPDENVIRGRPESGATQYRRVTG
jgi:hypothetical protein